MDDEDDGFDEDNNIKTTRTSTAQLRALAADYQVGVAEVHRLLSRHAAHVLAYQQQQPPSHTSSLVSGSSTSCSSSHRIYLQRVEHRLALSKRALLQQLVRDVAQENTAKVQVPPRSGTATTTATTIDAVTTTKKDPGSPAATTITKRKREDGEE